MMLFLILFTIEEISKGIKELKLRKASGNDSISTEMIIAGAQLYSFF